MRNEIKHDAGEKADPNYTERFAACKKRGAKSVAACTIKASAHCYNMRNERKYEAAEKAVPHVDKSATDDAGTDTEDAIERPYRGVVWTNPRMVAPSSRSSQSPDNHMLAVSDKAATSAERDADLAADDACDKGKADPHVSKSVAACKRLFSKSVAAYTIKASSHCNNMRNEIKHEAEEKAVSHVDESATDDAIADTKDAIDRRYRGKVWTNPRMVALMAPSSKSTQSPDNHMLAVPVKAATSAERDADAAELAAEDACKKFMTALVQFSGIIRCRSIRGQAKVMARASHEGITSLLCVDKGCLSVVGGAELDETMMCVPLQYAKVHLVPDCDNMFQISVLSQVADGIGHGIFVAVRDRSARDRWLASLSGIPGMKIDGWLPSPDTAYEVEIRNCMNGALPLVKWIS